MGNAKGKESHQQNILEIRSTLIKVHEFSTSTKIGKFYYISLECNKFTFRPRKKKGICEYVQHCVHTFALTRVYHCTPQTQILYNQRYGENKILWFYGFLLSTHTHLYIYKGISCVPTYIFLEQNITLTYVSLYLYEGPTYTRRNVRFTDRISKWVCFSRCIKA